MMYRSWIMAGLVGVAALGGSGDALALRCGSDLVDEGDPAYEVRAACGEPDFILPLYGVHHGNRFADEALWYYNFGPGHLLRELRIRGGRVEAIRTAGRGFREGDGGGACRPLDIATGMTGYELLVRCGEPVQRESRDVLQPFRRNGVVLGHRRVRIQDWFYRFGDRHIDRRVRLVDGRVTEVDTVD